MLRALHLCNIGQTPDEFSYRAAQILSLEKNLLFGHLSYCILTRKQLYPPCELSDRTDVHIRTSHCAVKGKAMEVVALLVSNESCYQKLSESVLQLWDLCSTAWRPCWTLSTAQQNTDLGVLRVTLMWITDFSMLSDS